MLGQRKRIHDQVCNIHKEEIVVPSPDFSLEDMTSQSVALVKAAAEQTSKALPESGTRAISSLWGKISQFTPVLQSVASELKGSHYSFCWLDFWFRQQIVFIVTVKWSGL